jgi:hypothetical protein
VGEKMSTVEAREKLKEFIKMVGAAPKDVLVDIIKLFEKFWEDTSYRVELMGLIRNAVRSSIADVFNNKRYRVGVALAMYDDFMSAYYARYSDIVDKGDIGAFMVFLDKAIEVLRSEDEYREIVEDIWIDLQEILKEVLGR